MNNTTPRQRAINLGIELGKTAKARGITQKAISDATGYPAKTISRVCRGEFPAMSETLCAIAGVIGMGVGLFDLEELDGKE